ncbi:hypothetical protein DL95DRAFT_524518 [Leptodontidium sp. 2 PMI_412]|nr:hypothetical protein DL95DRAFT_524518 [Leptodontidium sp. 2 PMI_412]
MSDIMPEEISGHNGGLSADAGESVSIETLPTEILSQIFGYLDTLPPSFSIKTLHDEPRFDITSSDDHPLKASSLVSRLWREILKPVLFKHAQFIVRKHPTGSVMLSQQIKPFFDFITSNSLQAIQSFTLLVHDGGVTDNPQGEYRPNNPANFWFSLFQVIDPVDLLIVAAPEALGALTSCRVYLTEAWNFDCPCHYLRLQRMPETSTVRLVGAGQDKAPNVTNDSQADGLVGNTLSKLPSIISSGQGSLRSYHAKGPTLFAVRPWDKLLLNEGSFIKAYATYEFWLRKAPSILPDLIGSAAPTDKAQISPTIRDMSYIAMFPMCNHFADLTENLPRLDRLYCQLVPRNEILSDPRKMVQVESEDLWMERNASYAALMRELFNSPPSNNYQHLKIFESGDAADRAAWGMAVEYVKRAGNGWKVGGDGVFVRRQEDIKPSEGETEEQPTTFHGSLIRWAWNGTAELPVSAYPLYDHPMGP